MTRGMRHPSALRLGPVFASMSVIALLALACLSVPAQADSSGVQYSDAIPKAEGDSSSTQHKNRPPVAHAADEGGISQAAGKHKSTTDSSSSKAGSSEGGSSSKAGEAASQNDRGGNRQGSPASGSSGKGSVQPGDRQSHAGSPAPASTSDDGSSPLVPILIAIAVLAAISIAAALARQRRQRGPTTPASPKAS